MKTILITGATDGIGELTAGQLAAQGHKVLLHGRSAEKLAVVAAKIDGAETYRADLSDLAAVRTMAAKVMETHNRLDVLINNAGVLKAVRTKAPSGRDIRFEVNTLAPYVLTRALLPIIPVEGRIINLSSAAQGPVDVNAMADGRAMDHMDAYAQSKLALTIWSSELAREFPNGPSIVSVNPGSLLASKMVKEGFGIAGNDLSIGAGILMQAALSEAFEGASGRYFDNDAGRFAQPHIAAQKADHVAMVMAAIRDLVGEG